MSIVTGVPRRPRRFDMFADLTAIPVLGFAFDPTAGVVHVEFDGDLDQATAALVKGRLESRNDVDDTLRHRAREALATNRAYLALANPTAAESQTYLKAVARQLIALERILLGDLDGTD